MADVKRDTITTIHPDGTEETTIKEHTQKIERIQEPDYIKIYTQMWCEFNEIPIPQRAFFFELVMRMNYADTNDKDGGQIVYTGTPTCDIICEKLQIKRAMYQRNIKILCDCGAIRRVAKGCYQINPQYAGKGEWKYNPKFKRGGIEDLIASFNFKDGTVDTNIIWADDGTDSQLNKLYRDGLEVDKKDNTVLKTIDKQLNGQMEIDNIDMDVKELTNV